MTSLAPAVQLSMPGFQDTMHSALAPNALDAPPLPARHLPESGPATHEIEPYDVPAAQPDSGEHEAQLATKLAEENPLADESAQEARAPEILSASAPRTNSWLVPLSLALTAGVLSFAVALPIAQRLHLQPATRTTAATTTATPLATVETAPAALGAVGAAERTDPAPPATTQNNPATEATSTSLPPGVAVAPDKGLLTLKTAGVHSIFVDDEFVGRGPERTVTLVPGQHKVRVSLNGEEHTETVEVVAGRLIQRSLDSSGN
jgi:hypothetical protein